MLLNTHTYYSLRYGAVSPKEWVTFFSAQPWDRMAVTDINNTSGCMAVLQQIQTQCPEKRGVIGVDFRNGIVPCYVILARNWEGFRELNAFLSTHLHAKKRFPKRAPVAALSNCYIIYPFALWSIPEEGEKGLEDSLQSIEFLGVAGSDLNKIPFSPLRHLTHKMVAMPTATFRSKRDFNAHRLLRAIDQNVLLSKLPKTEESSPQNYFLNAAELDQQYAEMPYLLRNAAQLLENCNTVLPANPALNLQTYTGSSAKDFSLLKKLCKDGLHYRYPKVDFKVKERIDKELALIREKNFVAYFLINWDIVNYAQRKGYFYVGRGSGANSIVAYLLRITDVDPIELDLYFERFINLYRSSPPDFDLDFSWRDREDITQYIFKRFPHTALLATYTTFQYKAVVRELGKVFGLPKHEIDKLSKGRFNNTELDQLSSLVLRYSSYIQGFPNHLSIHAGGILIANDSLHYRTATFLPPKGFPTVQFDMIVAEDIGLHKFDILSQRGLSKVKDGLRLAKANYKSAKDLDICDLATIKKDPKVAQLLRQGKAMGCFYVESPGMRMLLTKLKVSNYLGLVAASSIIRPGVSNSGMMREYILRYTDPSRRKDAHPIMLDIMPETFGVMVYQEDVIKVAHYFAGLTLGESDVLRRAMSGKFRGRSEFTAIEKKYFENCKARGYSSELSREIWRQIESFAGYAFAKGHSASYAVESYQSLYLKAHYPLAFMVAVINNFGGFYKTEFYVHEARKSGGIIEAPCVQHGDYPTTLHGKHIYLGFVHLQGFDERLGVCIAEIRAEGGPFKDLADFVSRVPIGLEQLVILVRINAFRFTGKTKQNLLWEAYHLLEKREKRPKNPVTAAPKLFYQQASAQEYKLPVLQQTALEEAFDQLELLGFPLCDPFLLAKDPLEGGTLAAQLESKLGHFVAVYGYLVVVKYTKTVKGDRMNFATYLDRDGEFLDSVHFPKVAAAYPFRGPGIYKVCGKVIEEHGYYSIEASSVHKVDLIADPRYEDGIAADHDNYSKTANSMRRISQ